MRSQSDARGPQSAQPARAILEELEHRRLLSASLPESSLAAFWAAQVSRSQTPVKTLGAGICGPSIMQPPARPSVSAGTASKVTDSDPQTADQPEQPASGKDTEEPAEPLHAVTADPQPALSVWRDNEQLAPGTTLHFGQVGLGRRSLTAILLLHNSGDASLTISAPTLPPGVLLLNRVAQTVAAGADATVFLRMNTDSPVVLTGQVTIRSNDPAMPAFVMPVSGTVGTLLPDLTPVQPQGWSGPLAVSAVSVTNLNGSSLFDDQPLRIDLAVGNSVPAAPVRNDSVVRVVVDGLVVREFPLAGDAVNAADKDGVQWQDAELAPLAAGKHTFQLLIDPNGSVPEVNPNNNTLTRSITIIHRAKPQLGVSLADCGSLVSMTDNQAEPADVGKALLNGDTPLLTFVLTNTGDAPLELSGLELPAGFRAVEPQPETLGAGESAMMLVALETSQAGTFGGTIELTSNSAGGSRFRIPVKGIVSRPPRLIDRRGPSVILEVSSVTEDTPNDLTLKVTYTDASGINLKTLGNENVEVTGPGQFQQRARLVRVEPSPDGRIVEATYAVTAPGGRWDKRDFGEFRVRTLAGQVADRKENFIPATDLGAFTVDIGNRAGVLAAAQTVIAPNTTFRRIFSALRML